MILKALANFWNNGLGNVGENKILIDRKPHAKAILSHQIAKEDEIASGQRFGMLAGDLALFADLAVENRQSPVIETSGPLWM